MLPFQMTQLFLPGPFVGHLGGRRPQNSFIKNRPFAM